MELRKTWINRNIERQHGEAETLLPTDDLLTGTEYDGQPRSMLYALFLMFTCTNALRADASRDEALCLDLVCLLTLAVLIGLFCVRH